MWGWFTKRGLPPLTGRHRVACADYVCEGAESTIIRLYYPTESSFKDEDDFPLVQWLPRAEYAHALVGGGGWLTSVIGGIFYWISGRSTIPAYWQAPLLKGQRVHETTERFPCVVFSHGLKGNRCVYSTFCCELASKGCVVAAVEHRDESASVTCALRYEESQLIEQWIPMHKLQQGEDEYELRNKQVLQRAKECSRVVDFLGELNNGTCSENLMDGTFDLQQFRDSLDTSKIAFVGHSFGSCTGIVVMSQEKRFRCGVLMDIWMYPIERMLNKMTVAQPVLLISNKDWQWRSNEVKMKELRSETLQGEQISIMIRGTDHLSQCDLPCVSPGVVVPYLDRSTMDQHEALRINKTAMWEFISRKLGLKQSHSEEPLLDEGTGLPNMVTIEPLEGTEEESRHKSSL